jgi:hypothetical protein
MVDPIPRTDDFHAVNNLFKFTNLGSTCTVTAGQSTRTVFSTEHQCYNKTWRSIPRIESSESSVFR